jgi:serine/threonine-protein kinase
VLTVGDVVEGRYKILDTIDTGGMGTVLLAEHVLIKRRLAIKVLHENLATDSKVVERFMNEASVAGRLGHPNIVESTDMGFTSGHIPFIVFEYLEGVLLTSEIYRVKGLTVRRALKIANQIASALDAAHSAGIVHRDLKTDNIFLVHKEEVVDHVKVLDFGVSRFMENEESAMVVGTPEYMAPEQITTPDKVDARADIYALGVVLYEMITARRPFQSNGGDTEALLHSIVHDAPPPLTRGEAPAGLQEMLFTKLLAKDPSERYQSMKEVQGAIAAFHGITRPTPPSIQVPNIEGAQTPTPVPTPVPTPAVAVSEPVRKVKSYGAPIALIVLGLAAAGGGLGLMLGVPPEREVSGTTSQAQIDTSANQLALAFEAAANANQLRAEGLAMTPMLRAAVETDSATFQDMIKGGDFTITPRPRETVEIFQRKSATPALMLRIGDGISDGDPKSGVRYLARGSEIIAVAGVPVKGQSVEGLVVIASPVDLDRLKERIAQLTLQATIVGLGDPVAISGSTAQGKKLTAPIKVGGESRPVLEAVVPEPTITVTDRLASVRLALFGSGGALLLLGLSVLLLRARSR